MVIAQEQLFSEHRDQLLRMVKVRVDRRILSRVDASDVVQESLLRAHRARGQFNGTTEPEYCAWLRRILANVVAENARRLGTQKRKVDFERSLCESLDDSSTGHQLLLSDGVEVKVPGKLPLLEALDPFR